MKRRSTIRKVTDVSICPACGLRVSVGVQCATCNQWRHNSLPCTDPVECSVHFTPFMCRSCLDIAVRVDISSRRQFPTVDGAQKWNNVVLSSTGHDNSATASLGGTSRGREFVGCGTLGDNPDEMMEASLRAPAIVGAVKAHVRQLKRHASSIGGIEEPERILSTLDRVYGSDDDDVDSSSSSVVSSSDSDGDEQRTGRRSGGDVDLQTAATLHTRHRYGAQSKPFRFAKTGDPKLSTVLRESLHDTDDEKEDEILIDLRPEDFYENEESSYGANDGQSQLSSRTNSSSNLKRQVAAIPLTMDKQRSLRYLRNGGDQDVLRDHFENISFKGDLESARKETQLRKSAAAHRMLEQHKRVLRTRFLAKRGVNHGGGGDATLMAQQRSKESPAPTTSRSLNRGAVDPFRDPFGPPNGPLAGSTKTVVESHKRMYFADVPPPFAPVQPHTSLHPLLSPQSTPLSQRQQWRSNASFAVRLSEMEELPEPFGAGDAVGQLPGDAQAQDGESIAEGSVAVRYGGLPLEPGWSLPF